MANRGVRKPKRRSVPAVEPVNFAPGVGSRFAEAITREADLGGGLPRAPFPVIARTPREIASRAAQKEEANRRRGAADNVRGYIAPADPSAPPMLSAAELLADDRGFSEPLAGQDFAELRAQADGTYVFPQVSPTRTINPNRPRTLESGYERNADGPGMGTLRVRFRDGTPWQYHGVTPRQWQYFKTVPSPGRYINRVLNKLPYERGDF